MGNKFEVWQWEPDTGEYGGYIYNLKWSGNSLIKALFNFWNLKRLGGGHVKFEWR